MVFSVCLSVCLSIRHTFLTIFLSSYHHEIFRNYYQWQKWHPCKRSRSEVKVTEVNTQLSRFRTVTPVWIHIWSWNDAQSLMLLRRGALLFFKVIHQISRSRSYYQWQKWCPCTRSRSKVKVTEVNTPLNRFRTVTPVWIHISWWNDAQSLMLLRRGVWIHQWLPW